MLFNNSSNKIRIIGFLVSEVKIINAYAIEFLIAVPRKVKKESKDLMMFHCICQRGKHDLLCKNHLHKGCVVVVRGELRTFTDKSVKICSSDITISSQNK